jgi:hypothetical protein
MRYSSRSVTSEGKPLTKRVRTSSSEAAGVAASVTAAEDAAEAAWDSRLGSWGNDITYGEAYGKRSEQNTAIMEWFRKSVRARDVRI